METIKGVCWCESRDRWRAYMYTNGRSKTLGWFINKQDAINARLEGIKNKPEPVAIHKPRIVDSNTYTDHFGEYKLIYCSNGSYAKVDPQDYDWLMQWSWQANQKGYVRRTVRSGKHKSTLQMHRAINNTPSELFTDHINGDTSDNRRSNLRTCTRSQNEANKPPKVGKLCKYRGVTKTNSKCKPYAASIKFNGISIYLGSFRTQEQAALVYNEAAVKYFEDFAYLNELEADYYATS